MRRRVDMARIAVIGDVGGHADQLRQALRELGSGLVVIQAGGSRTGQPRRARGGLRAARPRLGATGGQPRGPLPAGSEVFRPDPLPPQGVETSRAWWEDGRIQVAAAIMTGGDEFLLTHAGLTLAV